MASGISGNKILALALPLGSARGLPYRHLRGRWSPSAAGLGRGRAAPWPVFEEGEPGKTQVSLPCSPSTSAPLPTPPVSEAEGSGLPAPNQVCQSLALMRPRETREVVFCFPGSSAPWSSLLPFKPPSQIRVSSPTLPPAPTPELPTQPPSPGLKCPRGRAVGSSHVLEAWLKGPRRNNSRTMGPRNTAVWPSGWTLDPQFGLRLGEASVTKPL